MLSVDVSKTVVQNLQGEECLWWLVVLTRELFCYYVYMSLACAPEISNLRRLNMQRTKLCVVSVKLKLKLNCVPESSRNQANSDCSPATKRSTTVAICSIVDCVESEMLCHHHLALF